MAQVAVVIRKIFPENDLLYRAAIWLTSRMLIWIAMLLVAPLLVAPPGGIAATFGAIATSGYEYADDGKEHNLAFFLLFPLIVRFVVAVGLPFEVAGTLVNNVAFLIALYCLYFWVKEHYGRDSARWATAVLALL